MTNHVASRVRVALDAILERAGREASQIRDREVHGSGTDLGECSTRLQSACHEAHPSEINRKLSFSALQSLGFGVSFGALLQALPSAAKAGFGGHESVNL
jgi:hypothetical protein